MIRYWFKYWNENRDILLDSKFVPGSPTANYPILSAFNDDKQITTLYDDIVVKLHNSDIQNLDIVNAKGSQTIALDLIENWNGTINVFDCEGALVLSKSIKLKAGLNRLEAPASGLIQLIK